MRVEAAAEKVAAVDVTVEERDLAVYDRVVEVAS
jgi:hypothetical protein